ncbi:MAG TPA: long-chain-fatty-acid--CoA ligase [Pseudogracilibacillus sp.]|nr:long-chain-fatty-acid--CoA ligase [Pseudogracilibacillus sp.]
MVEVKPWLKNYPDEIPTHINYDEKPLHNFLIESGLKHAKKKALHFLGKELTFEEVLIEAKKTAHFLQQKGLKKGDRVASMLPNCPQAVITYYGTLMAGGIVIQVNPLYTERELEHQLQDSGAKFIVCLDILVPRVNKVRGNTDLEHIIVSAIKDYLPFPKNLVYPFIQKRQHKMSVNVVETETTHLWNKMIANTTANYQKIEIDPHVDVALIQYTGGTTGHPKGVMLTHFNLVANVNMTTSWMYKLEEDKESILGVLPFFHVYGMTTVMNLSIMFGAKMILMPQFNATEILKTIEKLKPTLFPGAPTIYIGLLNHPDINKYDLSSIKACISGSAPLPLDVQEKFEKITGGRLVEGYGLTESSPVTHANLVWDKRVNGSIGLPWPDTDAKIVDAITHTEVPIGGSGELVVKGPQVMKGYWKDKEETEKVLKNGWLFTGDIGYMTEDGFFYVIDRQGDMIIAGGYNIYPREVEEVLFEHESIQEAAVVGVSDSYRGETVMAVVVLKEGHEVTEKELNKFTRKSLASYKIPRIYQFVDELPKTTVGKVLKKEIIATYEAQNKKAN